MKNKKIIIGSRGSKLALIYAERARVELLKNPEIERTKINFSNFFRTCPEKNNSK